MLSGQDFTSFGIGPVIFYLICAISSVTWLTFSITTAIRGMVIAPDKKSTFTAMFTISALFAAFFFFAVMKYEWLGGETEYDGMYHSVGWLGSMVIALAALSTAKLHHVRTGKILSLSFAVPVCFLLVNAALNGVTAGGGGGSKVAAYFIGFLYASIQIVVPFLYYGYINTPQNKQVAMMEREGWIKMGKEVEVKIIPNPAPITPVNATTPTQTHPQPESGDAFQDSNNWQ